MIARPNAAAQPRGVVRRVGCSGLLGAPSSMLADAPQVFHRDTARQAVLDDP